MGRGSVAATSAAAAASVAVAAAAAALFLDSFGELSLCGNGAFDADDAADAARP